MAGAIGLLLGAGLGIASGHARQQAQEKAQSDLTWHEFSQKMVGNMDAKTLDTPEAQKMVKGMLGEHADAGMMLLKARAQTRQQQAAEMMGPGGSTGVTPSAAGGTPANSPGLMMPQAGAPGPSFGPSQQAQAPQAEDYKAEIAGHQTKVDYFTKLMESNAQDEDWQKTQGPIAKMVIDSNQKMIDALTTAQSHHEEHQDTLASQKEGRAQHEADFQQTQAGLAQGRAANEGLRQSMFALQQQGKDAEISHQKEADADKRTQILDSHLKNIDDAKEKLMTEFPKLQSGQKPDAKVQVDSYNTSAQQFYRKHPEQGAPTLIKWTPKAAASGPLGGHLPGGATAQDPTIEAIPPKYGTNKKTGESGWIDADGYFYPESGAANAPSK